MSQTSALLKYKIQWEKAGVYVKLSGILNFEEAFMLFGQIASDSRYPKLNYRIYDMHEVIRIENTEACVHKQASISSASSNMIHAIRHKIAFVAKKNDQNRRLFHIYKESLRSPKLEAEMFPTLVEARRWIQSP